MMDLYDFNVPPDPKIPTWGWNGSIYGAWDSVPATGPNNIVIMNWAGKMRTKLFWAGKDPQFPGVKEHKQILVGWYNGWDYKAINLAMDSLEKLGSSDSSIVGYMYATYGNDYHGIESQANGFKAAGRWGTGPAFANLHPAANLPGIASNPEVMGVQLGVKLRASHHPISSTGFIQYEIEQDQHVLLQVMNVAGRLVETLINADQSAGIHRLNWNTSKKRYSDGIYFLRLVPTGKNKIMQNQFIQKMVVF